MEVTTKQKRPQLHIHVRHETYERIKESAEKTEMTVSSFCRFVILSYLKREADQNKSFV